VIFINSATEGKFNAEFLMLVADVPYNPQA
jgi:hypothetical protein